MDIRRLSDLHLKRQPNHIYLAGYTNPVSTSGIVLDHWIKRSFDESLCARESGQLLITSLLRLYLTPAIYRTLIVPISS